MDGTTIFGILSVAYLIGWVWALFNSVEAVGLMLAIGLLVMTPMACVLT